MDWKRFGRRILIILDILKQEIVESWSKKNEIVQKNWKLTGRKANFQFKFIRSEFIWSQVWTGKSLEEEF